MQIDYFWDVPTSSIRKELFIDSKTGVKNFCEKVAWLYQVLQNIELIYNYRREASAKRHKLCSFALA
jgi:hypothetical protein